MDVGGYMAWVTGGAVIVLLGEVGVGKTSIARRLVYGKFGDLYASTIGVDIYQYEVLPSPCAEPFQFLVWDTDGSYGDSVFRQVYARQAQAALIVSDASRPSTVDSMLKLCELFSENVPGRYYAHVVNKLDLADHEAIPALEERLKRTKVPYRLTSAKEGRDVSETFARAAAEILKLEG